MSSGGEQADPTPRIGVAISGGGHRAASWGFGALLAMVDARVADDVVSIASVSGGSITNGVVAEQIELTEADRAGFEAAIRPALRNIAHEGLFLFGPSTNGYIYRLFAAAGLALVTLVAMLVGVVMAGRGNPLWVALLVGPVLTLIVWALWLRKLPLTGLTAAAYLGGAAVLAAASLGAFALVRGQTGGNLAWRVALLVVIALAAWLFALWWFGRRSEVVDDGLEKVHYPGGAGRPTLLRAKDRKVHHVFCATELQAGDHAYFSPRLVYSYRAGVGTPGDLKLSTAVQSSSCFPGGMVARELDTSGFGLERPWTDPDMPADIPKTLVVNDGGVYDNMADQWEQGFEDRAHRVDRLSELQQAATHLVVVNAGKALEWRTMGPTGGLTREIRSLTRTISVLYDVTTSHRREGLVRRFRDSEANRRDLHGALVHIAQTPFTVARAFTRSPDAGQASRAAEVLAKLQAMDADENEWRETANSNSLVATTLKAIGQTTTVDLLQHAYWLTTFNLYVIFGWGDITDTDRLHRSRFEALCAPAGEGGAS